MRGQPETDLPRTRKEGTPVDLDLREPLRYLGVRGEPDPDLLRELSAAADKLTRSVTPRWEIGRAHV